MYDWRKMTAGEREVVLRWRKANGRPWHSPPHRLEPGTRQFIVSAACYKHVPVIGRDPSRMEGTVQMLLDVATVHGDELFAWCLLPSHYHLVLQTSSAATLLRALGQLHGRTSHQWNDEDGTRGRKVWFGVVEREMRSEAHLWASVNYVHNNPVKHGYVSRWQDWPWSSAKTFLDEVGPSRAKEIWRAYPVRDYGVGWDD